MLAQQTSLDQNLTGGEIKTAFQKSGLFLEASLASGSVSSAAGAPDLKAALIVLRQTLQSSLGAAQRRHAGAPATCAAPTQRRRRRRTAGARAELQEILLPQARVPVARTLPTCDAGGQLVQRQPAEPARR